jgi:hypothetical protein
MSDLSPIPRKDRVIIPLDTVGENQTVSGLTLDQQKKLEILRQDTLSLAKECNSAYNASKVNALAARIFEVITWIDSTSGRNNLNDYIKERVQDNWDTVTLKEQAVKLPIQLKFIIYNYGTMQFKHPAFSRNDQTIVDLTALSTAFYSVDKNSTELQRQEINRFTYYTYLGIAKDMLREDNTDHTNVVKVLLFALTGKGNVQDITGIRANNDYPGVMDGKTDGVNSGADAKYLLNQVLTLLTIAGDDMILRSASGIGVKNITRNNEISNLNGDQRHDALDIYYRTPETNANWEKEYSPASNTAAAKTALTYYQQAQQVARDMQNAGSIQPSISADVLQSKIDNLYKECAAHLTNTGLRNAANRYAEPPENMETIDALLENGGALSKLEASPYLTLFDEYYGQTGPDANAIVAALGRAERNLNITNSQNKTVTQRWRAVLLAKKAALAAAAAAAAERAIRDRDSNLQILQEAQTKFTSAAVIFDGLDDKENAAAATAAATAAGTAQNNYPQSVGDALTSAKAAAEKAGVNVTAVENNRNSNDCQKCLEIAKLVENEAQRRARTAEGILAEGKKAFEDAGKILNEIGDTDAANKANTAAQNAELGKEKTKPLNKDNIQTALNSAQDAGRASGLSDDNINGIADNPALSSVDKIKNLGEASLQKAKERQAAAGEASKQKGIAVTQKENAERQRDETLKLQNNTDADKAVGFAREAATAADAAKTAADNAGTAADTANTNSARGNAEQARQAAADARQAADDAARRALELAKQQGRDKGIDIDNFPGNPPDLDKAAKILERIRLQEEEKMRLKAEGGTIPKRYKQHDEI